MTGSTKCICYVFTINNWTNKDIENLKLIKYRYLVFGKEVGQEGTPHLQGYIYLKNEMTKKALNKKLDNRAWLGESKATALRAEQNKAYCHKQNKYFEDGDPPKQGKRSDIDLAKDIVKDTGRMSDVVDQVTSYQSIRVAECYLKYKEVKRNWKPVVKWYWGETGKGKTENAVLESGHDYYMTSRNLKWWEGYDANENVIIDDFRKDFCTFHELLRILNKYEYRIEVKGSSRQLLAKQIIITSCYKPEDVYDTREDIQQLLRRIDEVKQF